MKLFGEKYGILKKTGTIEFLSERFFLRLKDTFNREKNLSLVQSCMVWKMNIVDETIENHVKIFFFDYIHCL